LYFFKHEVDFYDLDRNLNFSRSCINDEHYQILFAFKLIELDSSKVNLIEFLKLQLYDNFYENKEEYGFFLHRMTSKDSISYLFLEISTQIQQWVKENQISADLNNEENELQIDIIESTTDSKIDFW